MKVWFFRIVGPLALIMLLVLMTACTGDNPVAYRLGTGTAMTENGTASPEEVAAAETAAANTDVDDEEPTPEPSTTPTEEVQNEGIGGGASDDDEKEDPTATPTATSPPTNTSTPEVTITVSGAEFTALANTLTALDTTPSPEPSTPTPVVTETLTPTVTTTPTPPGWTPSPTPAPCLAVRFVADVTVPDGTIIQPGEWFFKTWRVQNLGSCTWNGNFAMVYHSGYQLGGDGLIWLNAIIPQGHYVNLTIKFRAPDQGGTYDGHWGLRDAEGNFFGIGPGFDQPFHVLIAVPGGGAPPVFVSPASTDPVFTTAVP